MTEEEPEIQVIIDKFNEFFTKHYTEYDLFIIACRKVDK